MIEFKADDTVEVVVSIKVPRNDLKTWESDSILGYKLAQLFYDSINRGDDGNDPYPGVREL